MTLIYLGYMGLVLGNVLLLGAPSINCLTMVGQISQTKKTGYCEYSNKHDASLFLSTFIFYVKLKSHFKIILQNCKRLIF